VPGSDFSEEECVACNIGDGDSVYIPHACSIVNFRREALEIWKSHFSIFQADENFKFGES
jgi:hypothetical protein